jgi:2,4-didehydro-3-deoxy-L-rhamnonate hydrolase
MARILLRYDMGQGPGWAERVGGTFFPLTAHLTTTGELIEAARRGQVIADTTADAIDLESVAILSPITKNQQLVAQATNYRSHLREVGIDPSTITSNVFFGKAVSSLSGARDAIRRPARVRLLDYEVELGLVVGRAIRGPEKVGLDSLGEWIAGLVIANDVSARDLQVPEVQFFKGKSFRTFTPTGPYLVLVGPQDLAKLTELKLSLTVNGQQRQLGTLDDMIFKPAETLTELSEVMDLNPGDLIITGTPGGVALQPPGAFIQKIAGLLPPRVRNRKFIEGQLKRGGYLQPGDVVRTRIYHPDGTLDLGEQVNKVVAG